MPFLAKERSGRIIDPNERFLYNPKIMKRPLITFVFILIAMTSCRPRPERILPFTPPLQQQVITPLPDPVLLLFSLSDQSYTLTRKGTLIESPSGKTRLDLGQTVRRAIRHRNDGLLLQMEKQLLEITIKADETELRPLNLPQTALLMDACSSGLVILENNRLKWMALSDPEPQDTDIDPGDFLSLQQDSRETPWLICRHGLYFKKKDQPHFQKQEMTSSLEPPIAIIGRTLWAMTKGRHLLKYNLDRLSPSWIKELDHEMLFEPVVFGKQILLVTRSALLMALSEQGSQLWFASLGGIPLSPPLTMDEQILLPVRIRDKAILQTYDPRGRLRRESTLGETPDPPFLLLGDAFIYSSRGAEKKLELRAASTQYASTPSIKGGAKLPQDALIPISVSSTNLIEPNHTLTIRNEAGESVWSAQIGPQNPTSPVWKAQGAGRYTLHLESTSKNRPPMASQTPFTVFDRRELFRSALNLFLRSTFPPAEKEKK